MSELVKTANQTFALPPGLRFLEIGEHPRNLALLSRDQRTRDNPLGLVDSIDARRATDQQIVALLIKHGAEPVLTSL